MTNSHSDVDELQTLQREADEMLAKSKNPRSTCRPEPETKEEQKETEPGMQDSVDEDQTVDSKKTDHDLAVQIESVLKNMEEAATERPALALLAAFTLGIIVGQLLSRR